MISPVVVAVVLAAAILALGLLVMRNRRSDNIDSFRRQIDALSPEARRPVVDQVNRLDPDLDLNPTPIERTTEAAPGEGDTDDVAGSADDDDLEEEGDGHGT